jgi:hypothetical protein
MTNLEPCGHMSNYAKVCDRRKGHPDNEPHETRVKGTSYFWASCGRAECVLTDRYNQKRVTHSIQCEQDRKRIASMRGGPVYLLADMVGQVKR